MVIKKCKVCGKEFDARGKAKCCSPECSKINIREYGKQYYDDNREHILEYKKQYYDDNREHKLEYQKQYYDDNREHKLEYQKQYYDDNREHKLEKNLLRQQNLISELCKQYDGDLEQILKNIPSNWQVREAKMRVWFNESYYDGIIAKIKSTPVCEVTGEKTNDLVIHHLYSFNMHPELGNDPANMVRIATSVHNEFHKIYGYGNNTPKQWEEFIKNY